MDSVKHTIKKCVKYILAKRPVYTTANIVTIAPNDLLKGRFALITGGTSGIGFSIAELFLKSGASVCITGRTPKKIDEACKNLKLLFPKYNSCIHGVVLDNRDIASFCKQSKNGY